MSYQQGRTESFTDVLSDSERKLLARLLSDPFSFPMAFKTWLRGFVQEENPALVQFQGTNGGVIGDFNNHLTDPSNAHPASAIGFTPYLTLSSTDVQAAIQELLDEMTAGEFITMEDSVALHG